MASKSAPKMSASEARVQLAELEAEKTAFLAEAKKKGMWMYTCPNGKVNVSYPDNALGRTLKNRWENIKFKMGKCHRILKEAGEDWRETSKVE